MVAHARLRQLSLSELLDETFHLYRNNIGLFVTIAALVLVPFRLLQLLLVLLNSADAPLAADPGLNLAFFSSIVRGINTNNAGPIGWIYDLVLGPLLSGALIYAADRRYRQHVVTQRESLGAAVVHVPALLGQEIIAAIAIVFAALPLLCVFFVFQDMFTSTLISNLGNPTAPAGPSPVIIGMAVIVAVLVLIPALIVGLRLNFAAQGIVIEKQRVLEAIDRSWQMTKNESGRLVLFSIAIALITTIIVVLPGVCAAWIISALAPTSRVSEIGSATVGTITSCLTLPFSAIAYTLMYYDLRVRKEGFDLEQQIGRRQEISAPAFD